MTTASNPVDTFVFVITVPALMSTRTVGFNVKVVAALHVMLFAMVITPVPPDPEVVLIVTEHGVFRRFCNVVVLIVLGVPDGV